MAKAWGWLIAVAAGSAVGVYLGMLVADAVL